MSFFRNILNPNTRELNRVRPLVETVSALEPSMTELSDQSLAAKTAEFRLRIENGESPDSILPEAYAVAREVSRRVLDMRPFDVQLIGAVVLHQGRISEMQTGEGKTLVATLPSYLNAVSGKTVHVVTVNDYLARRDREWMGQIHRFLGLDVGLVVPGMDTVEKKRSYGSPIIYGTSTEFGFDYLRDHMAYRALDVVQSDLDYAIIDEVDSILIDEARTPLIISGPSEGSTEVYKKYRDLAVVLKRDRDYTVDEKSKIVALTDEGERRAEDYLGVESLNTEENIGAYAYIRQSLKAKELMHRDVDYVLKDGEVLIVDEFTGRILPGRRFSEGLHQAIEAKEGVSVREETDTMATITVQNYFRMYKKLAGMTGTALTEESEFREIYGLDVVVIPTNKPLIRDTMTDSIWKTEEMKYKAVVEEIVECHRNGRPVLMGTRSIEKSELVSGILKRRGVPHEVLNAKHHEREAEIVAQAGRRGQVTIATNMAGRGTDILLGGNPEFLAKRSLRQEGFDPEVVAIASERVLPQEIVKRGEAENPDEFALDVLKARDRYQELFAKAKAMTDQEHEEVVGLGGLHVLGTERHEARRIDNQLRGRAGRQGDPGSSRFYLSVEDELMRLFGGDMLSSLMEKIGFPDDEPIEHPMVAKSVETAQKRIEAHNFSIRKNVVEYDNVLNRQRQVIYEERTQVLSEADLPRIVWDMAGRVLERALDLYWPASAGKAEADLTSLATYMRGICPDVPVFSIAEASEDRNAFVTGLTEALRVAYDAKVDMLGAEMERFLRFVLLRVIDRQWVEQLRTMEDLREGIGLQAYGQRDPLVEYTRQGFELFQGRIQSIEEDTVRYVYRVTLKKEGEGNVSPRRGVPSPPKGPFAGARPVSGNKPAPAKASGKVGRNAPCPCGSKKKYKNCCGKIS